MEIFYICIILVGIFLVCFALIWMVVEKKRNHDYRLDIDERRFELQQAIEDADQLLTELNNFSSYIVNRMEEKQQTLEDILYQVEERLELIKQNKPVSSPVNISKAREINDISEQDTYISTSSENKGKLIPLDDRKREVIKLHNKGVSSTEIAKMLNMGKGEIELISRMCK